MRKDNAVNPIVPSNSNLPDGPEIFRKDTTHSGVLHARKLYRDYLERLASGEIRNENDDDAQEAA